MVRDKYSSSIFFGPGKFRVFLTIQSLAKVITQELKGWVWLSKHIHELIL